MSNEMRQSVKTNQFHFLRVNHHQLQLFRGVIEYETGDDGVDTDGLTGTCGSCDQQMG